MKTVIRILYTPKGKSPKHKPNLFHCNRAREELLSWKYNSQHRHSLHVLHKPVIVKHQLTALAGKALSMTGVTPRYKARIPSSLSSSLATSRIPLGYFPWGAANKEQNFTNNLFTQLVLPQGSFINPQSTNIVITPTEYTTIQQFFLYNLTMQNWNVYKHLKMSCRTAQHHISQ